MFAVTAEVNWTPSVNAQRYRVTVSNTPDFKHIVASEMSATTSIVLPAIAAGHEVVLESGGDRPGSSCQLGWAWRIHHARQPGARCDVRLGRAVDQGDRGSRQRGPPRHQPSRTSYQHQRGPYPKALWTHAFNDPTPADIVFGISDKGFSDFRATVGLEEMGSQGSVQFQVFVDGEVKAESPLMHPRTTFDMAANVEQGHEVTLRVLNGGDGYSYDHAAWGSPRFIKKGGTDPLPEERGFARESVLGLWFENLNYRAWNGATKI